MANDRSQHFSNQNDNTSEAWSFHILRGELKIAGESVASPFEYTEKLGSIYATVNAYQGVVPLKEHRIADLIQEQDNHALKEFNNNKNNKNNNNNNNKLAVQENVTSKFYKPHKLDYSATHNPTGIGITQILGEAYDDQQDSIAVGKLVGFNTLYEHEQKKVIQETIKALQVKLTNEEPDAKEKGSTLCNTIISGKNIYTTNLGDSLSYLCVFDKDNQLVKFKRLNIVLHQPNEPSEIARVRKFLEKNKVPSEAIKIQIDRMTNINRLGSLGVSRALGDNDTLAKGLGQEPDVYMDKLDIPAGGRAFIINACDGMTEQYLIEERKKKININHDEAVCALVKSLVPNVTTPEELSQRLAQNAFDAGSLDNITVMVKEINSDTLKAADGFTMTILDGHGNYKIAKKASENIYDMLQKQISNVYKDRLFKELRDIICDDNNLKMWQPNKKIFGIFGGTKIKQHDHEYNVPKHIANIFNHLTKLDKGEGFDINASIAYIKSEADETIADIEKNILNKKVDLPMDSPDNRHDVVIKNINNIESSYQKLYYAIAKALENWESDPAECLLRLKIYKASIVQEEQQSVKRNPMK